MPRPPRIQAPGALYHINSRGNRREPIYLDERDRRIFLSLLGQVVRRYEWLCLSYCLMDNHFHLLLETPKPNLSAGMQRLKGAYGRWFNDRYGLVGHLFQGRFHSELVAGDEHLLEVGRYIVLNPVRAGLARRAEDWPWSSYSATIGPRRPPAFLSVESLLQHFGDGWVARAKFRAFVEEAQTEAAFGAMSLGLTPAVARTDTYPTLVPARA
jgi:putative transposase